MAWRLFYSYSHEDTQLRQKLGTYLAPLKHHKKIIEWHDRKIEAGAKWESEISAELESADLILLLLSAEFLASPYCLGVEVEKALTRLKRGDVKVVPILLRPCLWEESVFSELQIIPRDAKAITSWPSVDEALKEVAEEIRNLVSNPPPLTAALTADRRSLHQLESSLDLVRHQVRSYARSYERTRQRMKPSHERTVRMEEIFGQMRALVTASYPLLDELVSSPFPGERLAAVAILQTFGTKEYLPFLVNLVWSEKPFVGYHAIMALHFAVESVDPQAYPQLLEAIEHAQSALASAIVGFDNDRQTVLREAKTHLESNIEALSLPTENYD